MAKKKQTEEEESESSESSAKPTAAASDAVAEELDKVVYLDTSKKLKRKYGKVADINIKVRDPFIPNIVESEIRDSLKKVKVLTASELAAKYNIRVSSMKKLLYQFEAEGLVTKIAGNSRIKIYSPN